MWVLKKRRKKHLGGKLSTETLRDEDGIGVHEMAKTLLRAIYEYCFHGSLSRNVRFFFFFTQRKVGTELNEHKSDWVGGFLGFRFFYSLFGLVQIGSGTCAPLVFEIRSRDMASLNAVRFAEWRAVGITVNCGKCGLDG